MVRQSYTSSFDILVLQMQMENYLENGKLRMKKKNNNNFCVNISVFCYSPLNRKV